jgi:hypothetical protein
MPCNKLFLGSSRFDTEIPLNFSPVDI